MAVPNSDALRADADLVPRLRALPVELCDIIIGHMVAKDGRISLLTFTQRIEAMCLPFIRNKDLLAIAQEQAVRQNRFFWPLNAPNITSLASVIAHLEIDLSIIVEGGNVLQPATFDLPAADVAKIDLLPIRFPKLKTLIVNVDNTARIAPRARYSDGYGRHVPAASLPEAVAMERCWKIAELLHRVRYLDFPRWRKNMTLKRKVVFVQSLQSDLELISPDPNAIASSVKYAKAVYEILDWPISTVYFCRREEVW